MAARSPISITVIKALFAACPNVCSYRGCDEKLTDPAWKPLGTNDSGELKLVDPNPPRDRSRFYRVRAE